MAIALLAGRLAGLVRELQLANTLGVSHAADVAVLLLTIPDLLVGLLLAGGLSAALVPRLRQLPATDATALFRRATLLATLTFGAIGLFFALFPDLVLRVLAPGVARPSALLDATAPVWVAVALPLTAASGVVSAYLNARDRFFIAGLGTLVFNLSVIAALSLGGSARALLGNITVAIAVGTLLRLTLQTAILPRDAWRRGGDWRGDAGLARAFAAGIGSAGLALLAPILVRAAASLLAPGTIASFNYAQKLTELPTGILITTISTVALTRFSAAIADGDAERLERSIVEQTRRAFFVAFSAMAVGVAFAPALVAVLFGHGAMSEDALPIVSTLARIALFGLPFVAISSMATAVLNARLQTTVVLRVTMGCVMLLPLLVAPGVVLASSPVLMGAVIGFQALIAALLARAANLRLVGVGAIVDARLATLAGTVAVLAGAAWLLSEMVAAPPVAALAISGVAFAAAMLATRWVKA
ncbi:MAG: lipid II flippase MurJ [Pseudomonadota bacterium]